MPIWTFDLPKNTQPGLVLDLSSLSVVTAPGTGHTITVEADELLEPLLDVTADGAIVTVRQIALVGRDRFVGLWPWGPKGSRLRVTVPEGARLDARIDAGSINAEHPRDQGQVHAQATVYEAEANLSENTYREGTDWARSTWRGHLNASGCTYGRGANFAECTWGCDVTLAGCTYEKDAVFMSTAFHGTAHMEGCTYRAGAYFSYSEFRGDTDFSGSVFRHDTEFVGCRWRGRADLSGCTLHHVSFEGSSHLRAITFRGTQFSGGRCVFDRVR